MKPNALMLLGACAGVVWLIAAIIGANAGEVAVAAFAAGAVFGKGYGIWESGQ